jgi:hypothetical protein
MACLRGASIPARRGVGKGGDASLGLFPTFGRVTYRLTNVHEIQIVGYVYRGVLGFSGEDVICSWARVVSSPRAFDAGCGWRVERGGGGTEDIGKLYVFLKVSPVGGLAVDAARARLAAVRRCPHGSALVGTTTNQTGFPLELVGVSKGPADA